MYRNVLEHYTPRKLPLIDVQGVGVIQAKPDTAVITVGVSTENEDVTVAQQENALQMNRLQTALFSLGIQKNQIETISYTVLPQYQYSSNGEKIFKNYEVINMISIKTMDLDMLGTIYDAVFKNGANRAETISFSLSNEDEVLNRALMIAAKQAFEKADVIARTYRVTLVSTPHKVTEVLSGFYPRKQELSIAVSSPTPIVIGEIPIQATLNVQFSFIQR